MTDLSMMDVIAPDRTRYSGMSDEAYDDELFAQRMLKYAIADMRRAIERVNEYSSVVSINMNEWEDFVHDSLPTERCWNEKIERARNP